MLPKAAALLTIVALLFSMGFFMLASPPLLVLKHDTPLDGRFIRSLFNIYYNVLIAIAGVGAAVCAFTGQTGLALAMASLVVFVFGTRWWFLSHMDESRGAIQSGDPAAVRRFRRLHIGGMMLNVVQLGTVAWGMKALAVI